VLAKQGGESVDQAIEAMVLIRKSSEQVSDIIQVISEIASQTNLLALNAAIEAARAGEHGLGFAVVADEVRKLAEGSSTAAGSIGTLITQIRTETTRVVGVVESGAERTEAGARTVERSREAFAAIERAVIDVTTRVEEIATAVERISDGTGRIQADVIEVASVAEQSSASAEQVSASTEETSASTQEMAASAQELAVTAERLDCLVGGFRI
jgi:methyl-accepting chemotaxis protein